MSTDYRPVIGDLVVIHDPRLAEQVGQVDRVGVITRLRKGSARVVFLPGRENFWIEDRRLYPHPEPESIASALLLAVSRAMRLLRPEEVEFEAAEAERAELHALCIRVDAGGMEALAADLGPRMEDWEIQPYGMALFTVVVRLRG